MRFIDNAVGNLNGRKNSSCQNDRSELFILNFLGIFKFIISLGRNKCIMKKYLETFLFSSNS